MEFEELEKAAFDTSCFSQCSLVTTLVGGERGGVSSEEKEEGEEEDLDKTLTPSQTKVVDDSEVNLNSFATKYQHWMSASINAGWKQESCFRKLFISCMSVHSCLQQETEGERGGKEGVKTLVELEQQKSLAAGLVFSDDEEWESFSHTPTLPREEEEEGSCPVSPWTSPDRQQCASSSTPLPLSPPHTITPPTPPQLPVSQHSEDEIDHSCETTPPRSTLTTRLFPALRQDKKNNKQHKSQPVVEKTTPPKATPPRYPREAEVKERLSQLETEIGRFRNLNSGLEQQTREKEEVRTDGVLCVYNISHTHTHPVSLSLPLSLLGAQSLSHLRRELSEFQEQMKRETEQFDNYKRQETKKLRYISIDGLLLLFAVCKLVHCM